jgi:hypothetical protein
MASARVGTLENKVTTLKGTVRERDEALLGTGWEIETLRATVRDKDEALQAAGKACDELRDESWAGRPMRRVSLCRALTLTLGSHVFANLVFMFQSWRSSSMRPRRRIPRSKPSSRPRLGRTNYSRAQSPRCVPIPRWMHRGTRLYAEWRCWVALSVTRSEGAASWCEEGHGDHLVWV